MHPARSTDRRIEAPQAIAVSANFHIAQPVPDQPPNIALVIQNTGAAILIAMDCGRPAVSKCS